MRCESKNGFEGIHDDEWQEAFNVWLAGVASWSKSSGEVCIGE
jgi:hypothetical protein